MKIDHRSRAFNRLPDLALLRGLHARWLCSVLAIVFTSVVATMSVPSAAEGYDLGQGPALDTTSAAGPFLPDTPFNYADVQLPDHFMSNGFPAEFGSQTSVISQDNTPANNPVTDAGATLGRVLFYDRRLSANGRKACSSCHWHIQGFSDFPRFSSGFAGGRTRRHAMGLSNARFNLAGRFFWDERAATLEDQVLQPFQDKVEMGLTLEQLVSIVESRAYYPELFTEAFGDEGVTSERISLALAQFVRSMVSFNAPYDEGRAQVSSPLEPFPSFSDEENEGKRLFFERTEGRAVSCADCHVTEAFINVASPDPDLTAALNNGLDAESTTDLGVGETTKRVQDTGKYRVPSLRNIGIRPPYMHDGRFETLEDVIEHYSTGIQDHPQLAGVLRDPQDTGTPVRLNFSESEKAALAVFLHTLTDIPFLIDPKFSDPFAAPLPPLPTFTPAPSSTPRPAVTETAKPSATAESPEPLEPTPTPPGGGDEALTLYVPVCSR